LWAARIASPLVAAMVVVPLVNAAVATTARVPKVAHVIAVQIAKIAQSAKSNQF
jgi:hypothetical protein